MNDLTLVTIVAALVPTAAALAAYQQGRKSNKTIDEIHVLTNSNLSRVLADLALANQRIEKLETLVVENSTHPARPARRRGKG